MKLVPAGTSRKTGKPYNAFYSCPDRECGTTAKLDTPVRKFEAGLDKENDEKKWDKISLGKCRYGFLLEAFKMGKLLNETVVNDCNIWAESAMTGKLPKMPIPQYPDSSDVKDEEIPWGEEAQ